MSNKRNRTRQKDKTGDSKVEKNDSPEIPDRGETSDIPGLPSGGSRDDCGRVFHDELRFYTMPVS